MPLIVRWPAELPAGRTFSDPVTAMDLTATVAAAGHAKPDADNPFDGVDLRPAFTGKSDLEADRPLFFRGRTVSAVKNMNAIRQAAVRMGKWKYVRTHMNGDDTKFKEALYNLSEDMAEKTDLAKSNPDQLRKMGDLMHQWETEMSQTAIPFTANPHKKKPGQKNSPP